MDAAALARRASRASPAPSERWGIGLAALALGWLAARPMARADHDHRGALFVVVDADDDDGDGVTDSEQKVALPADDLAPIPAHWLHDAHEVTIRGKEARLVADGAPLDTAMGAPLPPGVRIQGLRPGRAILAVRTADGARTYSIEVMAITFLDGQNHVLVPARQDAAISLQITNGQSLPQESSFHGVSADPRNVRLELAGPSLAGSHQALGLTAIASPTGGGGPAPAAAGLPLLLKRDDPRGPFRSPFVRLVADDTDHGAPGVRGRVMQVALWDRLRATWMSPGGPLSQDIRVGMRKPGRYDHSVYQASLAVHILTTHPGGPPVVGLSAADAREILRAQLRTANQIWAQCGVSFGALDRTPVRVVSPPAASLLSVAEGNGLPARGDGVAAFLADTLPIGPVNTARGDRPVDTAMKIAAALQNAGFGVEVTQNPRTQFGVHPSADVLVRRPDGALCELSPLPDTPLTTDSRQQLAIGQVDLSDGLSEFDNMNARAGTLEERALIKGLADRDPATIDIFVVNHFTRGTRQGEAFIEGSGGPLVNVLVLDRNGLKQRDSAFTMAHEIGHVLLDQPLHPDNIGPDRPWLLMDADSSRGTVYGPKRLTEADCHRVVHASGPAANPPLLSPFRSPP